MKVFKKIIAGVIAGTLVLAIATSAFAATATVSTDGNVTATGFNQTSGNMTVMVVNAAAYDAQVAGEGTISAADICYIDQDTGANVIAKLARGMGSINLKHGDYYVVVGGMGAVQKSDKIATITVGNQYDTTTEDGRNVIAWEVTTQAQFQTGLKAQLFNTAEGADPAESPIVDLTWGDEIITGEGEIAFEVVTELKNPELAGSTELEITSGVVSDRN